MAPIVLKRFELPVDCDVFLNKFWINIAFYERFLIEKLLDVGVEIGEWTVSADKVGNRQRTVRSFHPSKISFPGLPSHAESIKNQSIEVRQRSLSNPQGGTTTVTERLSIKEVNSFRGIPYSDYFHVVTDWDVKLVEVTSQSSSSQQQQQQQQQQAQGCSRKVDITVTLDFKFLKSTWLQGTIESNTKAELMEVYELWIASAQTFLQHAAYLDEEEDAVDDASSRSPATVNATPATAMDATATTSATVPSSGNSGVAADKNGGNPISSSLPSSAGFDEESQLLSLTMTESNRVNKRHGSLATVSSQGSNHSNHVNSNSNSSKYANQRRNDSDDNDSLSDEENDNNYAVDDGDEDETGTRTTEDEDLLFYDCEEGGGGGGSDHNSSVKSPPRRSSQQNLFRSITGSKSPDKGQQRQRRSSRQGNNSSTSSSRRSSIYQRVVPPPTPPDLRRLYGHDDSAHHHSHHYHSSSENLLLHSAETSSGDDAGDYSNEDDEEEDDEEVDEEQQRLTGGEDDSGQGRSQKSGSRRRRYQDQLRKYRQQGSTRDLAIQVVETMFVLAEFFFWQLYQFYCYELKELFDITPDRVFSRCINTFLPGWHGAILTAPDLYGPMLGVFLLPLTLLWSTETSHHGCNPTSQLGNACVVSFLLWLGLSGLYRILALMMAPNILYKHCLSIVGYSFVAWNIALLITLPLEAYKNVLPWLSAYLPLMIFGLPASLAQGLMFWEQTPASSMTLQPQTLPASMQHCATLHARCLQRILWAFPKILAFALIAGTHYQLLWYLARVFLPGRRQLCQLSALVQPARYADILAQKDLRVFALQLLKGESGK